MSNSLKVFISYSHKDTELKLMFETHLKVLSRKMPLDIWSDNQILPGTEWNNDIFAQLQASQIVMLLISPDFVASSFCYTKELEIAMENHEKKKAMVLPIYLRPGAYDNLIFTKIQTLPEPEPLVITRPRSVIEWSNPESAFVNIMNGIEKAIQYFLKAFNNLDPMARKDEIEEYLILGNHDKACNRMMDFINDFSNQRILDIRKMISYKSTLNTINEMMKNKEQESGQKIVLKEILEAREALTMNLLDLLYATLLPKAA